MELIISGVIAVICVFIIFIANIVNGGGLFSILVKPLISGGVIFGIAAGALYLLGQFAGISLEQKESSSGDSGEAGGKVDFTVHDTVTDNNESLSETMENGEETENSEEQTEESGGGETAFTDGNFSNLEKFDEGDNEIEDFENDDLSGDEMNSSSLNDSYRGSLGGSISGKSPEEVIKEKIGFDASYEDMAKAIRTKLKQDQ